jgi:cold shock CspA family protein/arsenate reductase-like glutaredoxin family protein
MRSGTIKFFNAGKGFGFVTPDGGDADIFLPAAALTASGLESVKQGLRVTFEQAPDTKGPKVIALKLLGDAPAKAHPPSPDRVSVYYDPGSDIAADLLNEVRSSGYPLQLHNYVSTPLGLEQLRRLSHMLSESGRSLLRRYDPLFRTLQLDDRFISDQDFWTEIAEHPALINGPVLLYCGKARICKSAEDARAFLNKSADTVPNPKSLSPRIAAMFKVEAVSVVPSPRNGNAVVTESPPHPKSPPKPSKSTAAKAAAKPKRKTATKPRAARPDKKKTAAKKAPKPVKKAKKPSKK